jgi:hypothetical protein
VEGGPDGDTGVEEVCAWETLATQSARTNDPSRKGEWDSLTLVLAAGVGPSFVFSQGLIPASNFAEGTSRMIDVRQHGNLPANIPG